MDGSQQCRWGILSTAWIAHKYCRAITAAPNAVLQAVASRDQVKAAKFAEEENIPTAYSSYDQLLQDPAVDAVYIPLPTGVRKEWVLKAAASKKHVLCEKPCATSLKDLQEMVDACKENQVQFMDGVMFEHHTRLPKMVEQVTQADFGQASNVFMRFSFPGTLFSNFVTSNIRMNPELEPFGALGDLGWYTIRFSLDMYPQQKPTRVSCVYHRQGERGIPMSASGTISFSGGGSATFNVAFDTCDNQYACVLSDRRSLQLDDFVLCHNDRSVAFRVVELLQDEGTRQHKATQHHTLNCNQETNMLQNFSDMVLRLRASPVLGEASATLEDPGHRKWPLLSLRTQAVLDAMAKSATAAGGMGCQVEVDSSPWA